MRTDEHKLNTRLRETERSNLLQGLGSEYTINTKKGMKNEIMKTIVVK